MKVFKVWHHETIAYFVLLLAILMDIGWLLQWPLLALPALIIGVALQTYLVYAMTWAFSCLAAMLMEFGWLMWLIAAGVWMTSEFFWDTDEKAVARLNPDRYTSCLAVAFGIMLSVLIAFAIGSTVAWWPIIYGETKLKALTETTKIEVCASVWFALWLLMETIWVHIDFLIVQTASIRTWVILALVFGSGAILGCSLCAYKSVVAGMHTIAWEYSAQLCWVLGNLLWMISDSCGAGGKYGGAPEIIVFSIGAVAACRCLFSWSQEEKQLLEQLGANVAQEKTSEA